MGVFENPKCLSTAVATGSKVVVSRNHVAVEKNMRFLEKVNAKSHYQPHKAQHLNELPE